MTLVTRKYQKVYDKIFREILKEGRVPSHADVVQRAGDSLPDLSKTDEPIYKYRPQNRGEVFDIVYYNNAIESIKSDLELLFSEKTEISRKNITRTLNAELFHSLHSNELKRLSAKLDSLLFSLEGAEDNFFADFDNFIDSSKLDIEASTEGVLDTLEESLVLPVGQNGTLRIQINNAQTRTDPLDLILNRTDVNNLGNIPGTTFGNIFKDNVNGWGITIQSETDGPLEASFTFRLDREEFINRCTIRHFGTTSQTAFISTSVDKINLDQIKEYSSGILLEDQAKIVSLDFEDRLVDYVHITLSKEKSDSYIEAPDGTKKFTYIFGLKNFSVYSTGRVNKATYVSKPFDFSENLDSIGKISISANESLPDNTKVEWSVAGVDKEGEIVGSYVRINPVSRSDNALIPKTVLFQDTILENKSIVTDPGDATSVERFQNNDFYQIGTLETEPLFGTASLFRGYDSWLRDSSSAVSPIQVNDNFVSFSKGDIQVLYVASQEVLSPTVVSIDNVDAYVVTTSFPALYNANKGHFLTPEEDVNPDKDSAPVYAIYSAKLNLSKTEETQEGLTFENGTEGLDDDSNIISKTIDLNNQLIRYNEPGDILIKKQSGTGNLTYVDGTDYLVKLDEDGFPTGEIVGLHPDFIGATYLNDTAWQPLDITYSLEDDILRFVKDITGRQVFFDISAGSIPGASNVLLRYRHPATSVLKASIKVKNKYGTDILDKIYAQGQDYIFDSANGTIQRLSTGGISSGEDVFVDFKYNDLSSNLEQFFIWCDVKELSTIKAEQNSDSTFSERNNLTPDTETGEEFLASIPKVGLTNLTSATIWPEMTGYVQFVVKSKSPDTHSDALINQVIKMKDKDGNFIFKSQGKYFKEMTARREPLTQVSYNFLKTNVLKADNSYFAIRTTPLGGKFVYQIITNFEPNTSDDLYSFAPERDQNSTGVDGLAEVSESWKITWVSKEASDSAFTKVRVKADLIRSREIDGNISAKVANYYLKVSY